MISKNEELSDQEERERVAFEFWMRLRSELDEMEGNVRGMAQDTGYLLYHVRSEETRAVESLSGRTRRFNQQISDLRENVNKFLNYYSRLGSKGGGRGDGKSARNSKEVDRG